MFNVLFIIIIHVFIIEARTWLTFEDVYSNKFLYFTVIVYSQEK